MEIKDIRIENEMIKLSNNILDSNKEYQAGEPSYGVT